MVENNTENLDPKVDLEQQDAVETQTVIADEQLPVVEDAAEAQLPVVEEAVEAQLPVVEEIVEAQLPVV